jgi:hypothetical protein
MAPSPTTAAQERLGNREAHIQVFARAGTSGQVAGDVYIGNEQKQFASVNDGAAAVNNLRGD